MNFIKEILMKNDDKEIKDFLIRKGKRKAVCPIFFFDVEKTTNKEDVENGKK